MVLKKNDGEELVTHAIAEGIARISETLSKVERIIDLGEAIRVSPNQIKVNKAHIETLVDLEMVQSGICIFEKKGIEIPMHAHRGSIEFLIQYQGRCGVTFRNGGYRILEVGDVVRVDKSEAHSCIAMDDDARQLWVCVPEELAYKIKKD